MKIEIHTVPGHTHYAFVRTYKPSDVLFGGYVQTAEIAVRYGASPQVRRLAEEHIAREISGDINTAGVIVQLAQIMASKVTSTQTTLDNLQT